MRVKQMRVKRLYFLIGCVAGLFIAIVGTGFKIYLAPVGAVNGKWIYSYQVLPYTAGIHNNAVKNFAKDTVLFRAVAGLGITVSDKMVEDEYQKYIPKYGGGDDFKNILLDTTQSAESIKNSIKKSILQQKAIIYFTEKSVPSEEDVRSYYEGHSADYPKGLEPEKEAVRQAVMAEQGEKAYNEYMRQVEQGVVIKVY